MSSIVGDSETAEALAMISAGFDLLDSAGVAPLSSRDAILVIGEIEQVRRRADAAAVGVLDAVDDRFLFGADGHASAKVMVRHVAGLSNAEAAARARTVKVCRALPEVAREYRSGSLGTDQVRLLGRVHSNPRVASKMAGSEARFLHDASLPFKHFEQHMRRWERLTDEDGPTPRGEVQHENRNVRFSQNFEGSWDLAGKFGSMQGASMNEILGHYVQAEWLADWEKARAEHGGKATVDDMPRTAQQRRADALWQLFNDAAAAPAGAVPPDFVHNVVWDADTFEEMVNRMAGGQPTPFDVDGFECSTSDGVDLDPVEAFANAMVSKVRRVVVDAASVVTDLGRARLFTGSARHAATIMHSECVWVGCDVPASQCEVDHLVEHSRDGRTDPSNGAPLCGKHNRWKQKGFRVWRDPSGEFHIYRPDGTKLE